MSENEAEGGAEDKEVRNLNVAQLVILKMAQRTHTYCECDSHTKKI